MYITVSGPLLGFPVQGAAVNVQELSSNDGTPLSLLCGSLAHTVLQVHMGDYYILSTVVCVSSAGSW